MPRAAKLVMACKRLGAKGALMSAVDAARGDVKVPLCCSAPKSSHRCPSHQKSVSERNAAELALISALEKQSRMYGALIQLQRTKEEKKHAIRKVKPNPLAPIGTYDCSVYITNVLIAWSVICLFGVRLLAPPSRFQRV
jgi:hypothetical protein